MVSFRQDAVSLSIALAKWCYFYNFLQSIASEWVLNVWHTVRAVLSASSSLRHWLYCVAESGWIIASFFGLNSLHSLIEILSFEVTCIENIYLKVAHQCKKFTWKIIKTVIIVIASLNYSLNFIIMIVGLIRF